MEKTTILQYNDNKSVIDKNKLQRARKRLRAETSAEKKVDDVLQAIYFDGRKDKTLKCDIVGGKMLREL